MEKIVVPTGRDYEAAMANILLQAPQGATLVVPDPAFKADVEQAANRVRPDLRVRLGSQR